MSYIKSKYNQWNSARRLIDKAVGIIGPVSVVGAKNQEIYHNKIKGMVKSGKQFEALEYAKQEQEKVRKQVYEERAKKLLK